jgi:hypothetical protein
MLISETQASGCVFISQQFIGRVIPHLAPQAVIFCVSRDQAFKEYKNTIIQHCILFQMLCT